MATQVQLRGGTTSEHSSFTGAAREVTVDTDKDVVVVHDGSTAGGVPMAKSADIITSLGGLSDASTTATSNLGLGTGAVDSITTGDGNTGLGDNALTATTTGAYNAAFGDQAMITNTTGSHNHAVGRFALKLNTSGTYNDAMGYAALENNTTASYNVAIGGTALRANTTGSNNTATGYASLLANTTGANNTATGYRALYANTTGASNTASGYNALFSNTTGYSNVALGAFALDSCTSGQSNTIVGTGAGEAITTGSNNVCIGTDSGAQGSMVNLVAANDRAVFGSQATTNAYVKVSWTVTSDERDKMNFADVPHGLSFVNSLQPIKFNFKKSRDNATPHGNARYGFKAQDILALEGDNPIIIDNEDVDNLKYQGEALMPVLVKAIQELSAKNDALEARLTALENA